MNKSLPLLGLLMLVAVSAQAQQPTQPTPNKTKSSAPKATVSKTDKSNATKGDSAMMNRSDAQPVDVNTATRAELIDGGWGQYADGIIASRPYTSMDQLSSKNIVPREAFDEGSARFNVGSQDGANSPMRNQSTQDAGVSPDMSGSSTDSTNSKAPVPGSTAPAKDSTAAPSR